VVELYEFLRSHGLDIVVDGGGADALLGSQSRPHSDLDIALPHEQVRLLRRLLADRGYIPVDRTTRPSGTSSSRTLRPARIHGVVPHGLPR
jgi:hypothetical protein